MDNLSYAQLGYAAGITTAVCWSASYVFFTHAVRQIGPRALNALRLLIALVFLLISNFLLLGNPLVGVDIISLGWLALSGIVGFAVADAFLFRALFHLGAHRSSLVMTLVPVFSALLGWACLAQQLSALQAISIFVTIVGIVIVVSHRQLRQVTTAGGNFALGLVYGIAAAAAQSARYIFSVQALQNDLPVLSANLIQIFAATAVMWGWLLLTHKANPTFMRFMDASSRLTTVGGAIAGPFLGVTVSMVALKLAPVGIASTLMALPPILLLPFSFYVLQERISVRSVVGSVVGVLGVAGIFLS